MNITVNTSDSGRNVFSLQRVHRVAVVLGRLFASELVMWSYGSVMTARQTPSRRSCSQPQVRVGDPPAFAAHLSKPAVPDPDDAERKAIIGITGVYVSASAKRVAVTLTALDAAVRRGAGCSLAELLARLGGPLRDRLAETASRTAARDA